MERCIMSIEKARAFFREQGIEGRVQEFDVSSATVELAAEAVGVEPARIAKTLSFKRDEGCVLIVAAGDAKIDNRKFKDTFDMKASMLPAESVESLVGHAVGGVCPFGRNAGVPVYIDRSVQRFDSVYPAVGSSNSAIELSIDELYSLSDASGWVDVCKLPETQR
jgi:prolyl-tRNA editing enzyme YbaK/EbsC (Cys-tRNA(Pro) deacylase)